jgi:PAS domain S-box-containing protein
MKKNGVDQQRMLSIFLVSCILQSCFNAITPAVPYKKNKIEPLPILTQQIYIQPLLGRKLTAQGGHMVTFHEKTGQLVADVKLNTLKGFKKDYQGVAVFVEQEASLLNLVKLNQPAQQQLVHFQITQREKSPQIIIYKQIGIMGGGKGRNRKKKKGTNIQQCNKEKGKEKVIENESEEETDSMKELLKGVEFRYKQRPIQPRRNHSLALCKNKEVNLTSLGPGSVQQTDQFLCSNIISRQSPSKRVDSPANADHMLTIADYRLLNCLHEGNLSNTYRAIRLTDNLPVVLKISKQKTISEKTAQRFRREFELCQQIHSPYVVRYLELKQDPAYGIALIMEDDQAVDLGSTIPLEGFPEQEFLEIAIQIVQGLQAIHTAEIIHNDLKLNNILIQPTTRAIKIIDFNCSSTLRQERQPAIPMIVGTLNYISPEQTGRINRSVDYRTDFYALGIIFYRLLCGRFPFAAQDALGLIHQHLTKQPLPPHKYKSTISLTLSQMVMKLLEKEAENRYQSCEGILYDLTSCLSSLQETGTIPAFNLCQQDFSNKLILSQHLYGRERKIKTLINAFERISEGSAEVLMIAGPPGVGKTTLIQEIQKPITLKQGYFVAGKFDQLNKNVAYGALTQAFDGLVKQVLTEDEDYITQWKTRLLSALGTHIQFIIKIVPSLALLVGEQPPINLVDINQAKNIFNLAFQEFVNICANAAHPLVIFLDDLQWADNASLELMTYLMQQPNINYLLWIGAYRDTEVNPFHPALQAIDVLQETPIRVQTLTLAPLSLASLCQWIADSLQKSLTDIQPLCELIFQKTGGNPFFVKTFLQTLYDQRLLTFSPLIHWQWDLTKIKQHPATENVITLMIYQIQQLPIATQTALNTASCLGHRLSLNTLQVAMADSQNTVFQALQPALNSGIIIQVNNELHFAHDRVQEAAYHLLSEAIKSHAHLTIGRRLLASPAGEDELLFEVLAQFNRSRILVTEPKECLRIAHLNLKAAQKAKQATAYITALNYLYASQTWVDTKALWKTDYLFAFTWHRELAEVEYLCGHFEASETLIKDMQPHLQSVLDKVDIFYLLIIQKVVQGLYQEAINLSDQTLQLLGSGLPLDNPTEFIQKTSADLKQQLCDKPLLSLLDVPLVVDPEKQALFKILGSIYGATYLIGTDLLPAATLMSIKLSLKYGHVPESCHNYAAYGFLLCDRFGDYALGYQFGNLALQLAEKLHSPVDRCRSAVFLFAHTFPWSKHIRELPSILTNNFEACLACGDIEYAGYSALHKIKMLFYQGIPLAKVQQEALPLLQFAQNTKNPLPTYTIQAVQRVIANLTRNTQDEWDFDINAVDEAKFVIHCQQASCFYVLCLYHIQKAFVFYLYGHFEEALYSLTLAKENLTFIPGHYAKALFNWYDSLIRISLYPTASEQTQLAYFKQIIQNQQQMEKWKDSCPENFAHKYILVEGELARIQGDFTQAETHYDQAIALAAHHGFIHECALTAERVAQYWLVRGKTLCAQGYLSTAFNGYKQWGAKRKLSMFKSQYESSLKETIPTTLSHLSINQETTLSSDTLRFLDLSSILKASQTISGEIELSKLLRNMMQIIVENAGAQKGAVLFVEPDETLVVQAEYAADGTITTLQNIPLSRWANGARAVIEHVKREQKPLVIDDARKHEQFGYDPYISQTQAKSIFCVPLLKHTELRAILYIENNLLSHAFTPDRMQPVLVLTIQMAISLENARYVAEQIALNHQLTEQSTRRQIAEQSLHAVTHDLKLALEASQAGTWNWLLSTNYISLDATNCALFGLKPGEFKGTYEAFLELVHPDDRGELKQNVQRCLEQDIPYRAEYRVIWPDGSQHMIAAHGHVYRDMETGKPIKTAGVCLDITERKRLEQERLEALQQAEEKERQRADEAERYSRQQREFVNTVCHEVRNPMNGILHTLAFVEEKISILKSLQQSLSADLQPKHEKKLQSVEKAIKTIKQCADHQLSVLNGVLNLSKIEAGKEELVIKPFNPKIIIEEVATWFKPTLKSKQIDLIVDLPKQAIGIRADVDCFKRVLINLISNAVKFTNKGHIKISLQNHLLDSKYVELTVCIQDTGIGMTPDEQAHLFEHFSRPRSSQYEGSGLGLAISKKLIDLMKGTIQVESVKGQGTSFTIRLICEVAEIEEVTEPARNQEASSLLPVSRPLSKHILVAEDNITNQKILAKHLHTAGYTCIIAGNGQKAIEALSGGLEQVGTSEQWNPLQFGLILMDWEMPIMDGLKATEWIRKKERQLSVPSIPIIGLSAYAGEAYSQEAEQAGMDAYTTKPYNKIELFNLIEAFLLRSSRPDSCQLSRDKER